MRFILYFCVLQAFFLSNNAFAVIKNHSVNRFVDQVQSQSDASDTENMDKDEIIATLKNDIAEIDSQLADCKKKKKGWTAATVIGSVGVVGTGVSALVQNKQIQEKKTDLKNAQEELKGLK